MSRRLIGSINRSTPAPAALRAAFARLATKIVAPRALMHQAGQHVDALAAGCFRIAQGTGDGGVEILLAAGNAASPRSPASALPAGVLNSAMVRPLALSRAAISLAGAS